MLDQTIWSLQPLRSSLGWRNGVTAFVKQAGKAQYWQAAEQLGG
jgi:hypothetical protein